MKKIWLIGLVGFFVFFQGFLLLRANKGQAKDEKTLMELFKESADIRKKQVGGIFEGEIDIKTFTDKLAYNAWSATLSRASYCNSSSAYYILQKRLETIEDSQVDIGAMLLRELDEIRVSNQEIVKILKEIKK